MSKDKAGDPEVWFEIDPPEVEVKDDQSHVRVDHEGKFIGGQVGANVLEEQDGTVKITRPDGSTIIKKDGEITIENLIPKSVGIRDLFEIEAFAMRTVDQMRIYRIEFFGGGHVEVVYSQDGQVIQVAGHNLKQSISNDNQIIVSQGDSASGPVH